ncbi:MAG TPA: peptidoglycan editing factor PgeF [Anaeromyxobacteraceae bacterium]|nr:peptidoglycan editing factor PgeF [Anaeromyxobacteraceae bacterium]
MDLLSSALLAGFPHGFTTRRGEASGEAFASFNLGGAVGDDGARVAENWRALRNATGLAFARVLQVHGDRVLVATEGVEPGEEADAVLSTRPGVAACVSVADCVPVLIGDPRSGAVVAVHAGWRGTLAHAAARAVEALSREVGAQPGDLLAAIGPAIGPCCYEVSPDLAQVFRQDLGPRVAEPRSGSSRVDLWLANELVLRQAGLSRERIEVLGRCTSCEPDTFFSHRRDRGRTGRQVGFIAPAPSPLS